MFKQVLSLYSCIYPFAVFPVPCSLCTALRHCFLPGSISPTIQIPGGVKKSIISSSPLFVSIVCFLSVQPVPHPLTAMLGRVTDCQRCALTGLVYKNIAEVDTGHCWHLHLGIKSAQTLFDRSWFWKQTCMVRRGSVRLPIWEMSILRVNRNIKWAVRVLFQETGLLINYGNNTLNAVKLWWAKSNIWESWSSQDWLTHGLEA